MNATIHVRGAFVVDVTDGPNRPVRLLGAPIGDPPHTASLRFVTTDHTHVAWMLGGPLLLKPDKESSNMNHEKAGILQAPWIGMGVPLAHLARPCVILPPCHLSGELPYPCTWRIDEQPEMKICAEIVLKVPDVSKLVATYGWKKGEVDVGNHLYIENLPLGASFDHTSKPTFDHIQAYSTLSNTPPSNIKKPKEVHCPIMPSSVNSVCPPIVYAG